MNRKVNEMNENLKFEEVTLDDLMEIELTDDENFLKIKETLSRIGVSSRKEKTLWQSCHILHKRGKYYLPHFKHLFALDGRATNITDNDVGRRNKIAQLLEEWGLIKIVKPLTEDDPIVPISQIKIIPYKEKGEWNLEVKYRIGSKR